ncbi:hypothetical protein EZV62_022164 [Acer yangbiense]|uniref:Uncharacterized protein n=1 Tax=Acer yangbiense TaxID=1000413 RepID=A0A5C7H947_9ROSI|nr:hypothetical protein EZV62_022164 [Acer yangbiense]
MEKPEGKGSIDSLSFNQADFWIQIHQIPLLCMTKDIGRFLGGMIGEVLDVEGGASGDCVGKFMRVRVRVNISGSLKRCLRVDILGDKAETVMMLRYKRLPNHYFKCGMINHTTSECLDEEPVPIVDGKLNFPFGIWLRASSSPRKSIFHNNRRGSFPSPENQIKAASSWRNDKDIENSVMDQIAEDLMGSVKESVMWASIIGDNIMLQQVEKAVSVNDKKTNRKLINGKELVGETCEMLVEEKCEPRFLDNGISNFEPQHVSNQMAEEDNISDIDEKARVAIDCKEQVGEASDGNRIGDWVKSVLNQSNTNGSQAHPNWIEDEAQKAVLKVSDPIFLGAVKGFARALEDDKPNMSPLFSNSGPEEPSVPIGPIKMVSDGLSFKRRSKLVRIRKLGSSAESSKKFCGKRKSVSREDQTVYGGRKSRKMEDIAAIEEDFSKSKS